VTKKVVGVFVLHFHCATSVTNDQTGITAAKVIEISEEENESIRRNRKL
jgi:hypothetical protein